MLFGGLQKVSLIDYPGKLACTVFTIGCNFRCPFCYSSELVLPEKIKNQPKISEKEISKFLRERKGLLEAITICGGEPTMNEDLPRFCGKIKKLGYSVKLDTNGSNPAMLENLIAQKLVDYVAMDIKAPIGAKIQNSKATLRGVRFASSKIQNYEKATGAKVDLTKIKKSIEIIKNSGIDYEFRTTVVSAIHAKKDILRIAREISPAKKYFLQNFLPKKTIDPKFAEIKPESEARLLEIQKAIAPLFDVCLVR